MVLVEEFTEEEKSSQQKSQNIDQKEVKQASSEIPPICNVCKKDLQVPLKLCSICKQVAYCSKECQKEDWPKHKTTHIVKIDESKSSSSHCIRCKKILPEDKLKRCSRCKKAFFCSVECWNKSPHKMDCLFNDDIKQSNKTKSQPQPSYSPPSQPPPTASLPDELSNPTLLKQNIDMAMQDGSLKTACSFHLKLGDYYLYNQRFDEALKSYENGLKLANDVSDPELKGASLRGIGNIYYTKGKAELAIQYHSQDMEIAKEYNLEDNLAAAYGNIAGCYQLTGDLTRAKEYLYQTLELVRKRHDKEKESSTLANLAMIYTSPPDSIDPAKAIMYSSQCVEIAYEINNQVLIAQGLFHQGRARHIIRDHREAARCYKESLKIAEKINWRPDLQYRMKQALEELGEKI